MSTQCTECKQEFSIEDALCDDWKDPKKAFGCPHCGTFYVKDMRPDVKSSLKGGIFAGGICTPAAMLLARYYTTGDVYLLVIGCSIIISSFVILCLETKNSFGPLRKSSYRQESNDI